MAAHRQNRPWTGGTVAAPAVARPAYDPSCYLCPGNARVGGARNPRYDTTFVFDNDHPCVGPEAPREPAPPPAPYRVAPAAGHARVVCFSPRHDLTLAEMSPAAIGGVVDVWRRETRDLGGRPGVDRSSASRTRATSWASPTRTRTGRSTRPASSGRRWRSSCAASARHLRRHRAGPDGRHASAPSSRAAARASFTRTNT